MVHGKYPKISGAFEVSQIPGLYVAGTLGHSLDFRKSAGGFIHGFRRLGKAGKREKGLGKQKVDNYENQQVLWYL